MQSDKLFGTFKIIIGITFLSIHQSHANAYSNEQYDGFYGGIGGFAARNQYRGGAEASITKWRHNTAVRTSILIYSAEDHDTEKNLFGGYSFSGLAYLGDQSKIYVGLGVFGGRNLECDHKENRDKNNYDESHTNSKNDSNDEERYCNGEDYYLFSMYPEIGLALHFGPLQLNPFVRVYFDTQSGWSRVSTTYGALITWKMH